MLIFSGIVAPILCIVQSFFPADYLHVQGRMNIALINHMEYRDILRNEQNPYFDNRLQQDIHHEMDSHLFLYNHRNYGFPYKNNHHKLNHILFQSFLYNSVNINSFRII